MYKKASRDQNIDRNRAQRPRNDAKREKESDITRIHTRINLRENRVALLQRRRARGKCLIGGRSDDDTIVFVLTVHRRHRNRRADLEVFVERLLRDGRRRRVHSERRRRGELLGDGLHFVYRMCV